MVVAVDIGEGPNATSRLVYLDTDYIPRVPGESCTYHVRSKLFQFIVSSLVFRQLCPSRSFGLSAWSRTHGLVARVRLLLVVSRFVVAFELRRLR